MAEKAPQTNDQSPPYDYGNPANTAPNPPNQPPLNQPAAYPPYQEPPPGQPGAYPPYQQPPPGQPGAYPPYHQPPPGQPGAYQQPPGVYPGGNQAGYGPNGVGATVVVTQPRITPVVVQTAPRQSDWMIPAIFACLFCFWPTGICAIIAASNANSAVSSGNAALIEKRIKTARNLTLLTVFLGIVSFIIIAVLRVVIANQTTYYG